VLSRGFVTLWFAMLVAMAGISMVSPLLPIFVQDELGGPAIAVALSFSGLAIAQIVSAPLVGRLGDRFGSKRFIVMGFIVYAAGAVGYLFATHWGMVVGFRILSGLGAAGVFPMTLAYVGRLAPEGHEGRYMGWFSVAQIGGFGLGPLLGGGMRDAFGSDAAFASMALMLAATAVSTFLFLPSDAPPKAIEGVPSEPRQAVLSFRVLLRRPAVQASTLLVTLTALGWGSASTWLAVYVISEEGLGTGSALFVGILLSGRSLLNAALQPYTGHLADRLSRLWLVVVGLAIGGAAQVAIPLVPHTLTETSIFGSVMVIAPWVLVAMLVAGLGEALAFPAQQAIFVQVGRRVGMSSLMGLNSMGSSLGFLTGSLFGALVKSYAGIESVFYMAGGLALLGIGVFVVLMRRAEEDLAPRAVPEATAEGRI
jgi:MFS transporter, DHA1 family, multidrug resistance protein